MPMDREDMKYFDEKFGQVHKRITESKEQQTAELHRATLDQNSTISELKQAIEAHKVESSTHKDAAVVAATEAARKAVQGHNDESWVHNPAKSVGLLAGLAAIAGAIGAGINWVIKHLSK